MNHQAPKRLLLLGLCATLGLLFAGLGVWQVERLGWKRDLIARVNARVHAPAVPPPSIDQFDASTWEYRRVSVSGVFEHQHETMVDALTDLGKGHWLLTPLRVGQRIILVNRGFVSLSEQSKISRPEGLVAVTGLLRLSEPRGRFLRSNRPAVNLWYSRDVQAIAAARKLGDVAPYFIDADAMPVPDNWPRGGLTVVRFRDAHLVYALTWFGLAALCVAGLVLTWRSSAKQE